VHRHPSPAGLKRLNRRQRKKRRLAEFQELIFSVHLTFDPPLEVSAHDAFLDAFIDMIESRDLAIAAFGGSTPVADTEGMVMKWRSGSTTETDRCTVRGWLEQRPEVSAVVVGELVDAHYGWDA